VRGRRARATDRRALPGASPLETCVVRIYRREEGNPRKMLGVLEEVESGKRTGFRDLDELARLLMARPRPRPQGRGRSPRVRRNP
jgi:hypothetical protein